MWGYTKELHTDYTKGDTMLGKTPYGMSRTLKREQDRARKANSVMDKVASAMAPENKDVAKTKEDILNLVNRPPPITQGLKRLGLPPPACPSCSTSSAQQK